MNRMRGWLATFALVVPAVHAAGDCVPIEQLPAPASSDRILQSTVKLQLVEPANGAAVDADSVLVVDVDYRVAGFEPGRYGLMMTFPALVSSASPHGPEGRYELRQPAGRVRICVPLRPAYEATRLRWPLSLSVLLNKTLPAFSQSGPMFENVATSEVVPLNSVMPSGRTEALQASVVDPAYRDAVADLTDTIVRMHALEQVCRRKPDLEVEFMAAFRGWAARNEPMIRQILSLQRDLYLRDMGEPELVARVMTIHSSAAVSALEQLSSEAQRGQCLRHTRAFHNPRSDLETAGAAQLAVIRAHAPAPLPADATQSP